MERLDPSARRDKFGSRINRAHSPVLAFGIPWLLIVTGSLAPLLPVIAPGPVMPPFGYIIFLAWLLLRPGLLPMWAGLPLGLIDDLFSGQPIGSAILLFSVTLLVIDLIQVRFPWRNFSQDWLLAALCITTFLVLSAMFSGLSFSLVQLTLIGPQILLSIVVFPIVARMVSLLDRVRLTRVRRIG